MSATPEKDHEPRPLPLSRRLLMGVMLLLFLGWLALMAHYLWNRVRTLTEGAPPPREIPARTNTNPPAGGKSPP